MNRPQAALLRAARLYAITPDAEPEVISELVQLWIGAGVRLIQLRHKSAARGRILELALELMGICRPAGVQLVVNDHLDVALAAGADGVHLGDEDLSISAARRVAGPGFIIGASAQEPARARAAVAAGADYVGSGPAFATPLKPEKAVIGPAGVARVQASVPVPVFAIGGVDESNLAQLRAAGVERVCVIRALASRPSAEATARRLIALLEGT
ncbi:MAG TPA: thiamine phosphate synthase [Candidatus Nitrosotalea sp.]|nr:thiamine phosphate synthase [Candidatus Nitrosotalea sp.]